jgi:hypothetical protein
MKTDTHNPESGLVEAAKVIGRTAGKVANLVGVGHADTPGARKVGPAGRIPKSNKQRLPRRQKKAQLQAAAKRSV